MIYVDLMCRDKSGRTAKDKQRAQVGMESSCDDMEHFQRWVSDSAFDATDICAVQATLLCESLLRQSRGNSESFNTLSQSGFDRIGCFHVTSIPF